MADATASPMSPQEQAKPEPESRVKIQSPVQTVSPLIVPGNCKIAAAGTKLTEEQSPS